MLLNEHKDDGESGRALDELNFTMVARQNADLKNIGTIHSSI